MWGPIVDQLFADEKVNDLFDAGENEMLWALTDHLGTPRDWIDNGAGLDSHIVYDSFGNVIDQTGTAQTLIGFSGVVYDPVTGLRYHRNRWAEANTNQFLSEDPIKDGTNWRIYVGNMPTMATDPSGLWSFWGKEYVWPGQEGWSWNPLNSMAVMPFRQMAGEGLSIVTTGRTVPLANAEEVSNGLAAGTATGGKAIVNQGAKAVTSTLSLGSYECPDLIPVTAFEHEFGYDQAAVAARVSAEIATALTPAQLAKLGNGANLAKGVYYFDAAGNVVSVGRGTADAVENGLNWQNGAQIVGGLAGGTTNYITGPPRSRIADASVLTPGEQRKTLYGHLWQKADLETAITRHAGPNASSWRSKSGKLICENPSTGRQVVIDDAGYFRIFQPVSFGSRKGQYLDMLGKVPSPARFIKGGAIKNVPLSGDDFESYTHFLTR